LLWFFGSCLSFYQKGRQADLLVGQPIFDSYMSKGKFLKIIFVYPWLCLQWNFSKPACTGTKKYDRFRRVAGFVRLLLQRIDRQELKKSACIQRGPVFWGSGLEKFHCRFMLQRIFAWTMLESRDIINITFPKSVSAQKNLHRKLQLFQSSRN
jgi:hypothetical protein